MKKILIFSTAYHPFVGGAEVAVKEITDRLTGDFNFDMITLNLDGKQKPVERVGNITIHRIGSSGKVSKLLFPFTAYQRALNLHKENSYDAIWSIMASFGGFAARFFKKKFPNVPYLLTLQEGDPIPEIEHKVRFVKAWFKEIFTLADVVQPISNYLADWARDMEVKAPIIVIPNGVSVKEFENTHRQEKIIGSQKQVRLITTSRLTEKNGVDDIISSLALLPENYTLLILGTGHLEEKLKQQTHNLHLEKRVHFLGLQQSTEVIARLHDSDIFIRPSRSEGMGNSFIEAMASGVPVIATPVGGIVDFLVDPSNTSGQVATGLFCKINNPQSIADTVMKYENDPQLKENVVRNAKEMVIRKYDWELIARDMKEKVFDVVGK